MQPGPAFLFLTINKYTVLYCKIQIGLKKDYNGRVILDPKGADAGSVSPGVGKSLRTVQKERDDLTTSTRLAIDPTTARKSRKGLGKNGAYQPYGSQLGRASVR